MPAGDDAGVYLLDERTALVQTVDVFSPPVDDPYLFGQIAAANSLSDVYAMGGRPITALSIVGFPARKLPDAVLREILRGGLDKMAEAGVAVIGGHSIQDDEIKAGFAVTGLVDPRRIATNAAARPGDRLVLTKPLGTGILRFAGQIGRARPAATAAAARSMAALEPPRGRTDGPIRRPRLHRRDRLRSDGPSEVDGRGQPGGRRTVWDDVPLLPGVLELAAEGVIPGAVERNKESSADALAAVEGVAPAEIEILFDAQTSGGLLIARAGVGRRGLRRPAARRGDRGSGGRRPRRGRRDRADRRSRRRTAAGGPWIRFDSNIPSNIPFPGDQSHELL